MKGRKIWLVVLFAILLNTFALGGVAYGEEEHIVPPWLDAFDIRILSNGNYIEPAVKPIEKGKDFVLAPLRFILENTGYTVKWHKSGLVDISKGKESYTLDSKKSKYRLEVKKGTIMIDYKYFEEIEGLTVRYDNLNRTLVLKSDLKDGDVYDYNLGKRTMKTGDKKDLTYTLNGGIMTPKTEKNPLVIVMHGSHGGTKAEDNRFDLGYSYLLQGLSEEGYVVVSPNVTVQYYFEDGEPIGDERILHIFEETLKALLKANEGENNFGLDLKDKIDFDRVVLVGHSRSGYEVFELNNRYKDDKRIDIKGLLSIAPAQTGKFDYDKVDNPVSIILPELDGDVAFLDGQSIFDEIMDKGGRKSQAQLVYLYGANHNAFNEALLIQDQGKIWYRGEIEKLKAKEQREFLLDYSKEYIASVLRGDFVSDKLRVKDKRTLGYKALTSNYKSGFSVYEAKNGLEKVEGKGLKLDPKIASLKPELNTVGIFNHPGNLDRFDLLNISWQDKKGQVSFKLGESPKAMENLSLYLAQDSTDKLNKKANQGLTVSLKDSRGKVASYRLDKNTQALEYVDGSPEMSGKLYSAHTPLSIVDIDLDKFEGIDRNNIREVILSFDQTESGSIFLRRLSFN